MNVSVIEDPLAVAFAEITSVVVDIDTTVAPDGIPVPDTDWPAPISKLDDDSVIDADPEVIVAAT